MKAFPQAEAPPVRLASPFLPSSSAQRGVSRVLYHPDDSDLRSFPAEARFESGKLVPLASSPKLL